MENLEQEIIAKVDAQNIRIEAIYTSVEKTRKYLLISMWVTLIILVLPLLLGIFVVPYFMSSYLGSFEGLL